MTPSTATDTTSAWISASPPQECATRYRKLTAGSLGAWYARYRDPETGHRAKTSLGDFSQLPPAQRYDAAKKEAEQWFTHLGRGGAVVASTVKAVCENYVKHVRATAGKGDDTADDLQARFARWVDDAPIGRVAISKLTRRQVETWRAELAATPVVIDPRAKHHRTRIRAASSVNRDCAALRAALNYAHDMDDVTTDTAWRVALRPTKGADGRRTVYLDREQRLKLIGCVDEEFVEFVKGMTHLPLRPGALAALTVGQLDKKNGVLSIGKDKAGQDRRMKRPTATANILAKLTTDKLPAAPLFARAGGGAWNKDAWKKPMKAAAAAAGLPAGTVLYTLRHSTITDLVVGGLDLLTVAQLSGTSVEMIDKHYVRIPAMLRG